MTESLLGISEVSLYGEKVSDMSFNDMDGDPIRYFVRVYGYAFEGNYYGMDAPIIMLLVGDGAVLDDATPKDVKNSFSSHVRRWVCDKSDHSVRLDELTGSVESILLEAELTAGGAAGRVSGGRVSGGRVSGGRVSGGRVSGKAD